MLPDAFVHQTGEVEAKKQPTRECMRILSENDELFIVGLILERPSMYLSELCSEIYKVTGKDVSASTGCGLLARHGLTRKKIQQIAKQRCVEHRASFMARMYSYKHHLLVWVDETGSEHRDYVRQYGYAIRGERAVSHRLLGRGQRVSAIAAISTEGVVTVDLHKGSVDTDVFADFVRGSLIPNMQAFDGEASKSIVIMDNLAVHHVEVIVELFREAGIVVFFLPPYSPDLNPIEEAYGFIKQYLKHHDELLQVVDDPHPVIQAAFGEITERHCNGWISHSGYCNT